MDEDCGCGIDWRDCWQRFCPRAARIVALQEAAIDRARELLGEGHPYLARFEAVPRARL